MRKKVLKKLNFTKISENISILIEACGIDARELAFETGLPASTISRLRSNTNTGSPNLSSLIPIANFFRISLSQLIGEEPINQAIYGTFKPNKITKFPIPILCSENIIDFLVHNIPVDAPSIDVDIAVSEKSFAYFLQGNAMEPQFPDKTLLIIDPEITLENLDHVLVIPEGKATPIFRQILIDGDEKYLQTLNPKFNEFTKFNDQTYRLLGVMIQSRKNFKDIELATMFAEIQTVNGA